MATEISIAGPADADRSTREAASVRKLQVSPEQTEGKWLNDQPLRLRPDDDAVRPSPIFLANSERCAA